ncbi:hypothetical protein [Nocardia cyriacigeorgica]
MRDLDNSYPDLAAMRVEYGAGPFDSEGTPAPAARHADLEALMALDLGG